MVGPRTHLKQQSGAIDINNESSHDLFKKLLNIPSLAVVRLKIDLLNVYNKNTNLGHGVGIATVV